MSSIGMERHETPVFEPGEDETGGPAFFWINPYNGQRELVAKLFWPGHPVEFTEEVEQLYSELELRRKDSAPSLTGEDQAMFQQIRSAIANKAYVDMTDGDMDCAALLAIITRLTS